MTTLTYENAEQMTLHVCGRDPEKTVTYMDEQQIHPMDALVYFSNLSAQLIPKALGQEMGVDEYLGIETAGDSPPLWMQLVTCLANEDELTLHALLDTISTPEQAVQETIGVMGLAADLMHIVTDKEKEGT